MSYRKPAGVSAMFNDAPAAERQWAAGPDTGVIASGWRSARGGDAGPKLRRGLVTATGIEVAAAAESAPDDHFRA